MRHEESGMDMPKDERVVGELVEGSGRKVAARRLDQMVSVRLDPELLAQARSMATQRGESLSDLIRACVADVVRSHLLATPDIRVDVQVTNSSGPAPDVQLQWRRGMDGTAFYIPATTLTQGSLTSSE
jgi:hypothetical protein